MFVSLFLNILKALYVEVSTLNVSSIEGSCYGSTWHLHQLQFSSAKHMDFLGVQVGWVTGPWFLSIFINMLPWESGQVLYSVLVLSL